MNLSAYELFLQAVQEVELEGWGVWERQWGHLKTIRTEYHDGHDLDVQSRAK